MFIPHPQKYVYKQHKHDNYSDRNRHINTISNDGDQPCQADILHILWSWWNYSLATRCYWCFFIPTKILLIIISRTFKSIKAHHKCFRSLLHKFIIYEEMYSVNYLHRAPALLHSNLLPTSSNQELRKIMCKYVAQTITVWYSSYVIVSRKVSTYPTRNVSE